MKIGEVSKRVGIGIETIRFYERMGLIDAPRRTASGYRTYAKDDVKRLDFVKKSKALGFTLNEIRNLLSLRLDPNATCEEVKEATTAKIKDIEERIKDLQKMKKALNKLIKACDGLGPAIDCPILDSIDARR